ncbi:oxidoreductase-like domain-containing protein [Nevskia sp.]|uniref:oxidoreductase-like domain-containing protein n=1 Tax=Nevskia sp. TaxID=1929292 RepID=UPI0025FFE2D2|nr:oxidoreductase-like domain-containing protein [Nevskia sp.]
MTTSPPPKPEPPNPQDCCESGCTLCVYTVYDEELARWREAVKAANQSPVQPADRPPD